MIYRVRCPLWSVEVEADSPVNAYGKACELRGFVVFECCEINLMHRD